MAPSVLSDDVLIFASITKSVETVWVLGIIHFQLIRNRIIQYSMTYKGIIYQSNISVGRHYYLICSPDDNTHIA